MTRKRFVKLLMAAGYDRNEANAAAAAARSRGVGYSTACIASTAILSIGNKLNTINIDAVCDAIRAVAVAAQQVASAICKAMTAFAEAYTAAMEEPSYE